MEITRLRHAYPEKAGFLIDRKEGYPEYTFLHFYNSVELTFVSWRIRYFLVEKIFINAYILRDSFLVEIPLIRVQDGSMYMHSWRSS